MRTRLLTAVLSLVALTACASPATEAPAPAATTEVADAPDADLCPWCGQDIPPGQDPLIVVDPDSCIRGPIIWSPRRTDAEPIPFEPSCWVPPSQWSELPPSAPGDRPMPVALPEDQAHEKARVDATYQMLLRKIAAPSDYLVYGDFYDYGRWEGTAWAGHEDLPPGDWVYVYPHWYIWESPLGITAR